MTFDIDANGILNVTALDKGTGKKQNIAITAPNKLDDAEVERLRKEAEQFSDADAKKKEEIDIINQADTVIYQTEKSVKDFEGKVDAKEIAAIKEKTEELKKLMAEKEKDTAKIKAKLDELNQIAQKAATELYQKAGAQPGQAPPGAEQPKEAPKEKKEDVVDAEVVDDKEKKE